MEPKFSCSFGGIISKAGALQRGFIVLHRHSLYNCLSCHLMTFYPQKQTYSSFENNTRWTYGPKDQRTARPLIEMRSRIQKGEGAKKRDSQTDSLKERRKKKENKEKKRIGERKKEKEKEIKQKKKKEENKRKNEKKKNREKEKKREREKEK